ncbi:hypothetical protein IHV10_20135 [Fictibacillus sp. 5RED26]|nr:hypothetical protein [Fictibacillus sp. 5RED26]
MGVDDWDRPVYKCIETNQLYKDITLGNDETPSLYCCGNVFEGEPGFPINSDLEVRFIQTVERPSPENRFNYMLLDRLRTDCDYYLGYGNRNAKNLWANNEKEQIAKMKDLYNGFTDDEKPEWLTYEQILQYEKSMVNNN